MKAITIAHLLPDLLDLYGDQGNVRCLEKRCEWRGLPVKVLSILRGQSFDFSEADIVFLGDGSDRSQKLASDQLFLMKDSLKTYLENEGALLAVGGGFQLLGKEWPAESEIAEGLGVIDMTTRHKEGGKRRIVGDVVLRSSLSSLPVVGYENHEGRTFLGEGVESFGQVISSARQESSGTDAHEGLLYKHVLGTYLHGPFLAKNPQIADSLLQWVADVRSQRGEESFTLLPLDDSIERAAHEYMLKRLGVC